MADLPQLPDEWADLLERNVTRPAANDVLWHYGDRTHAVEPGSFRKALVLAAASADPHNLARLAFSFPDVAAAVQLAAVHDDGMDRLRRRVARPILEETSRG